VTEDEMTALYDAAWKNAPPSIGMDILADQLGFGVMGLLGDCSEVLVDADADLTEFATRLAEEILRLANEYNLAPFDGTLAEGLEEGDTEQDWLLREDLLPFIKNWSANVRAMP